MLPKRVKLVMLSATVTNVIDFANWIGRTRSSKIYVVFTLYRPVPLEHYLYVGSNTSLELKDNMQLIRKADSGFLMQGYVVLVKCTYSVNVSRIFIFVIYLQL